MHLSRLFIVLLGVGLLLDGLAGAQPAKDVNLERPCTFRVHNSGTTETLEGMCPNNYGGNWVIESVGCWSTSGQVTVLPQLHGGTATSVLPEPLTCGAGILKGVKVKGAPTVYLLGDDAAKCPTEPCYLDVVITAPEGSGDHQATVSIVGRVTAGAK